ncbi:MAG: membrane protein of unknown function [Promethearchaeota archaeon]|nr:MAG: membrane protein of unknown function [Candidatus Lokiarchaeota archaeon]
MNEKDVQNSISKEESKAFVIIKRKDIMIFLLNYFLSTMFIWWAYIIDMVSLSLTLILTFIWPLGFMITIYTIVSERQEILNKVIYVGLLGYVFSIPLWLILGFSLLFAPWAIFGNLSTARVNISVILLLIVSYLLMASIMYIVGKRKKWKIHSN